MGDSKLKESKVREYVKSKECRVSADVMNKLDLIVSDALNKGMERAKTNGRTTIKANDL